MESILGNVSHTDDKDLLNVWYKRDTNAIPPVYVLQNIDKDIDAGQLNIMFMYIKSSS